jgi:quercetin dioxygenase-like cupin family protein
MHVKSKSLIGPDEGKFLPVLDIVHKVGAGTSGVAVTIEEWSLPSGQMIPPHTHAREDEVSFVLEGELTSDVGGEIVVAPAGSYVVKPRDVYHAFYNAGPETVRVMEILVPGSGFEGYFPQSPRRARQTVRDHLARRPHPRGQGPLRHHGDRAFRMTSGENKTLVRRGLEEFLNSRTRISPTSFSSRTMWTTVRLTPGWAGCGTSSAPSRAGTGPELVRPYLTHDEAASEGATV